jgi:hypothetical protein
VEEGHSQIPSSTSIFTAAATSFSLGLEENTDPAVQRYLLYNFGAFLRTVLGEETFKKYISADLSEESKTADGHAFGKPAWGFKYPKSNSLSTKNGFTGCKISTIRQGDLVCVALGNTFSFILRPDGNEFLIRGYAYVHGLMRGEQRNSERQVLRIR